MREPGKGEGGTPSKHLESGPPPLFWRKPATPYGARAAERGLVKLHPDS